MPRTIDPTARGRENIQDALWFRTCRVRFGTVVDPTTRSNRFKSAAQRTTVWGRRLDEPGLVGRKHASCQLDSAVYFELLVQAFQVGVDRPSRQAEGQGGLLFALVRQDAPGDLDLTRRKIELAAYARPGRFAEKPLSVLSVLSVAAWATWRRARNT